MIHLRALIPVRTGDDGATMIEYALILVTILVVVVVGAALVGAASSGNYLDVESCFDSAANC